jgi:hypothetical protein
MDVAAMLFGRDLQACRGGAEGVRGDVADFSLHFAGTLE